MFKTFDLEAMKKRERKRETEGGQMTSQNYRQSVWNLLSSFNTRVRSIIDMNRQLKKDHWRWLSVHVCCAFYTIYASANLSYGTKMRTFLSPNYIILLFFLCLYFLFAIVLSIREYRIPYFVCTSFRVYMLAM